MKRLIVVLVAGLTWLQHAHAATFNFSAFLTGSQEVGPTPSAAFGAGIFSYDDSSGLFGYHILFTDFLLSGNEVAAHIHQAPAGVNGPVIIPLPLGSYKTGLVDLDTIAGADPAQLLANGWYVNIHSTLFPGGEIRGQIINCSPRLSVPEPAGAFAFPAMLLTVAGYVCRKKLFPSAAA